MSAEPAAERLSPGEPFGPYVVEGFIASGGMGHVYAARHGVYGSPVALKVLLPTLDLDPDWRRRFTTEGAVGQQLKHPHVCSARELVEHEGRVGIVLDLVSGGKTLARCMADRPDGLPLQRALRLFLGVLQGVAHAHQRGVIHGDIKPENVLIDGDVRDPASWTPRVTDFGTVGLLAHPVRVQGRPAVVVSPRYASPEHMRGVSALEPRSDVYALGLLLHLLLAGQHASSARTVAEAAECTQLPLPVVHLVDQPAAVFQLIRRATARDIAERHPSVEALAVQVRAVLDTLGTGMEEEDLAAELATELMEERAPGEPPGPTRASSSEEGATTRTVALPRMDVQPADAPEEREAPTTSPTTRSLGREHAPAPARPTRRTQGLFLGLALLGAVSLALLLAAWLAG